MTTQLAFAEPIDFSKCASNADHHCMEYLPTENTGPQTNPNWNFDVFLPDNTCNITGMITPTGDCTKPSLIESDGNWTQTKMNTGIMSITHIHTVASTPSTNYCPYGLYTLTHQDGYLYKNYDPSIGRDLTAYMYPKYCHLETGPNPINGDASIPAVPEFTDVLFLAFTLSMFSCVVVSMKVWKFK